MFSDKDNEGNGKINKMDKSGFVRVPLMRYIISEITQNVYRMGYIHMEYL